MRSASTPQHVSWRELAVQAVLLLAVLAVLFPGVFFRGEMAVPADNLFQFPPWNHYAPAGWERPNNPLALDPISAFHNYYVLSERALEAGEWPLWNPYQLFGTPLLANYQSAVFYPPRLLFRFLDTSVATTVYVLLKLWLCGATAYVCGRGLRFSVPMARFFSLAWMLSSYVVIWSYWPLTDVSAWMPIAFLGVELALRGAHRRAFWTLAFGGTMMLLAGHPETAFAMGLGLALYVVARLALERRRGRGLWMPLVVCGGAWIPALLVCAVQILPFLEFARHSTASANPSEGSRLIYLQPGATIAFWFPRFYGTDADGNFWGKWNHNICSQNYVGILVWFGMVLLLAKGVWARAARRRAGALAVASGVMALLSFSFPSCPATTRQTKRS